MYPSLFRNILSICYKQNTTQESADNLRRYSNAGAKIKRLLGSLIVGGGGVVHLRYYRSSIGAPQSKDMNASRGRRSELTTVIRIESCLIYSVL